MFEIQVKNVDISVLSKEWCFENNICDFSYSEQDHKVF